MLFLFSFNEPQAKFTSMLWVIILHQYKSFSHKLIRLNQYAVIAGLIQLTLHLVQIPYFTIGKCPPHYNRTSSMLYGWCDTGGCSSFSNSLPHIFNPKISNFDLSVQRTILANQSLLTLFCFHNSDFLTVILPYRPDTQSLLLTVDTNIFFHNIGSVVQWCFKQLAFCQASWWLWWNCPLHR